jgi:hypothetical protein
MAEVGSSNLPGPTIFQQLSSTEQTFRNISAKRFFHTATANLLIYVEMQ